MPEAPTAEGFFVIMNIYFLTQKDNLMSSCYDSATVIADTREEAITFTPNDVGFIDSPDHEWARKPEHVIASLVGRVSSANIDKGVIGYTKAGDY